MKVVCVDNGVVREADVAVVEEVEVEDVERCGSGCMPSA